MQDPVPTKFPIESSLRDSLEEHGSLPVEDCLRIVCEVADEVRLLHNADLLHGSINVASIYKNSEGHAVLSPVESSQFTKGRTIDRDLHPPELQTNEALTLSTSIDTAGDELRGMGIQMDPRRIDVYQLSAVLCRSVTGKTVSSYLRSVSAKSGLPPEICRLIEGGLGFNVDQRLATVDQLIAELDAIRFPVDDTQPNAPDQLAAETPAGTDHKTLASAKHGRRSRDPGLPFHFLGHYEVLERIGRGGMGDVYKAFDGTLNRMVAVKVLPSELAQSDDFIERFKSEATAVARLTHPNIVQIHAIGEDSGHHYFVMQYVPGPSLAQLLRERRMLPVAESLEILEQLLSGLAAAHKLGLIHRDIKPGNVLLDTEHDRALLADFGLVKSLGAATDRTATGVVMGTADYLSPEQGLGQNVDQRSDLYSIGVLAYQMLSGRMPFVADSPTAMIFQHIYEEPPSLADVAPHVPAWLAGTVAKLMSKAPSDRCASTSEVVAHLKAHGSIAVAPNPRLIATAADQMAAKFGRPGLRGISWQVFRERVLGLIHTAAPEAVVKRILNTQHQVDAAVADYEGRCGHLKGLVAKAEQSLLDLEEQAAQQVDTRESDNGDSPEQDSLRELRSEIGEQQSQLHEIQLRHAKANAVVVKLKHQRDLLNARLHTADEALRPEDTGKRQRSRYVFVTILVGVAVAGIVAFSRPGSDHSFSESLSEVPTDPPVALDAAGDIRKSNLVVLTRDRVRSLAFLPDNPTTSPFRFTLAAAGTDSSIYLCEIHGENHGLIAADRLSGHLKKVNQIAISPDGTRLASASDDMTVQVWDLQSQHLIRTLKGHAADVTSVVFSSDGSQLLSGSSDSTVRQWDIQSEREIRSLEMSLRGRTIDWFHDGTTCIVGSATNGAPSFKLWSLEQERKLFDFENIKRSVYSAAFAGSRGLAICLSVGSIHVNDTVSGKSVRTFGDGILCAAYSRDGFLVVTGNRDGRVTAWDVSSGTPIEQIGKHSDRVEAIALSEDRQQVATATDSEGVRIWQLPEHAPPGQLRVYRANQVVHAVDFAPDGYSAISCDNTRVWVWNFDDDSRHFSAADGAVYSAAGYSPDGQRRVFATGQRNSTNRITVQRKGSSGAMRDFTAHDGAITQAMYTLDGRHVVSSSVDGTIRVWNIQDESQASAIDVGSAVNDFAVSRGNRLVTGDDDHQVRLWDYATGDELMRLDDGHTFTVNGVSISKNGELAASAGGDRKVILWDLSAGKKVAQLEGHSANVTSVALLPDGKRVLSGGEDGTVRLWEIRTQLELRRYIGHVGGVNDVAVSPDGVRGISGGEDGTVRIWDLTDR